MFVVRFFYSRVSYLFHTAFHTLRWQFGSKPFFALAFHTPGMAQYRSQLAAGKKEKRVRDAVREALIPCVDQGPETVARVVAFACACLCMSASVCTCAGVYLCVCMCMLCLCLCARSSSKLWAIQGARFIPHKRPAFHTRVSYPIR